MRIILTCLIGVIIGYAAGRLAVHIVRTIREKNGPICVVKVETFPLGDGDGKRVKISYNTVDTCPTIDDAINHLENAVDYLKSQRYGSE